MKTDDVKKAADEILKIADMMHGRRSKLWIESRVAAAGIISDEAPQVSESEFLYRLECDVRYALSLLDDALEGSSDD